MEHNNNLPTTSGKPGEWLSLRSKQNVPATVPEAMATPALVVLAKQDRNGLETAVYDLLAEADVMLGSGMPADALAKMAALLVDDFGGRSVGNLLLAVKAGVRSKIVGHKLAYPILCEWMHEQDRRVEEYNYNEYLRHK